MLYPSLRQPCHDFLPSFPTALYLFLAFSHRSFFIHLYHVSIARRSFFSRTTDELHLVAGQWNDLSTFVPEQELLQNISESWKILHRPFRDGIYTDRGHVINLFTSRASVRFQRGWRWVVISEKRIALICRCRALTLINRRYHILITSIFRWK